jgi:hypothetical protein
MFIDNMIKKFSLILLAALLFTGFSVQAMQLERNFPEGVKRGKLTTTALAEMVIDGKFRVATPVLRIYSEDNLTVTLASVDVKNLVINYLENDVGEVVKIWILTADEASVPIPKN